jgi:hypothetical protein
MNINELFLFKTIPCNKKKEHDFENCYKHHYFFRPDLLDNRRPLMALTIMNRIDYFKDEEIITKSQLHFYTDEVGFENDIINAEIFEMPPCKNTLEYRYHILNYKTDVCFFVSGGLQCPYGKFCSDLHTGDDEGSLKELVLFRYLFAKMLEDKMTKRDFVDFYNKMYKSTNSFLNSQKYMIDYSETKQTVITHIVQQPTANIIKAPVSLDNSILNITLSFEPSILQSRLQEEIIKKNTDDNDGLLNINIRQHICSALKNVPTISKDHLVSNVFDISKSLVYISNSPPRQELHKVLMALLNCHNGLMIYGGDINSERLIGMRMNRKQRDNFKLNFNGDYMDLFLEFHGHIKYKFYDLEGTDLCVLALKVKRVKDNRTLFDKLNKCYVIKEKALAESTSSDFRIKSSDVKLLNLKEYIDFTKHRIENYYKKKMKV